MTHSQTTVANAGHNSRAAPTPQLHTVVQVAVNEDWRQIEYPTRPWPLYVRLWGETEPQAVALVVGTLVTWGRESTQWSFESLEAEFPAAVPGGFAAVEQGRLIGPSCCCGLETWQEWLEVLTTSRSPWMGHGPSPFLEILGDRVSIWADGGLGEKSRGGSPIAFSSSEFVTAVKQAARDLSEFEQPLRRWLSVHAPRYEDSVTSRFRERFVLCMDSASS
jgi:hypothetical protein